MNRTAAAAGLPLALALTALGCHQYLDPRLYGQVRRPLSESDREPLQVRFLAVQGFVLRWRGAAVMTPPLYSNPPLGAVAAGSKPLVHRPDVIKRMLDPEWVKDVDAVLVGHSHHDHLMDMPEIWRGYARTSTLYGSRTMAYLMEASGIPRANLHVLNAEGADEVDYRSCQRRPPEGCVYDGSSAGRWVPLAGGRARVRALCSRHSPQFAKLPVTSQGCLEAAPGHAPSTSKEWCLGDTFAYLVDFLETDGSIAFRVYYQDSPTSPDFGYVPGDLLKEHGVDLAILCAGAFNQVADNPAGIIGNTNPRYVLLGHWENFFEPLTGELHTLFAFDFNELKRRLDATRLVPGGKGWKGEYWFPVPGNLFVLYPSR